MQKNIQLNDPFKIDELLAEKKERQTWEKVTSSKKLRDVPKIQKGHITRAHSDGYEINNEFKKMNNVMTNTTREKFELINIYTSLYKNFLLKIIDKNDFSKNEELLEFIEETADKLNSLNGNQIKISKLQLLVKTVDKILNNIENVNRFFEINQFLIKKFVKNNNILDNCEKKILSEEFADKINNDANDKFINWLLN